MQFLEANARRVVIKIGTHSIAGPDGSLRVERIRLICRQIATLRHQGMEVLVISSGAVGMGVGRLGLDQRPSDLASLQACAAVGQSKLVEAWQTALQEEGFIAAQILLTREDIRGRKRHLAVRNTLEKLLSMGVVPVVNENDTVSADEIKFGDNDVLSALVASLVKADLLVILSTISGLMEDQGKGPLIPVVSEITEEIRAMAGGTTGTHSTGGMVTKIEAARLATQSGCGVFIGDASTPDILGKIHSGSAEGTFFVPQEIPLASRKRWIAFFEKPLGKLHLDAGAVRAIVERNSSLLATGVTSSEGTFKEGSVVTLHGPDGKTVARGIVTYDDRALAGILGKDSKEIHALYPQRSRCEVVHKDSLVLTQAG
ncbi:MAG: glutamate 5-kinase [Opitutales bacterium]|jgi:glutamate 5-kinase